jgi:hypothetical protein
LRQWTILGTVCLWWKATNGGLTALPDTAVTTNASLITSGSSTAQIAVSGGAVSTVTTITNQLTAAQIATGVWTDTTAGDFTTSLSVGKSIMNGVSLGTGLTINGYTGNTPQTGDTYARIGAAGAGLTALGDARIAHLDADISGRMATYTQPTGFLAATFPGTVASPTNITAGTITTATNVTTVNGLASAVITATSIAADAITDAKVAADVTIASVTGAVGSVTGAVGSVTGAVGSVTGNVGGNVTGSVGSVTGLTVANLDATISSRLAASGYTAPDNTTIAAIDAKTTNLPSDPADQSLIIAATNALASSIAALPTTTIVNAIKAKTDNLPASPAATGAAMTLTGAYDAAKTAATQTSVDGVKSVTDALPTFVHTAGKLWALDGDGNAVASATALASVKVQTDQMAFTNANELDVNVHSINDVRLTGTGIEDTDEWRPA